MAFLASCRRWIFFGVVALWLMPGIGSTIVPPSQVVPSQGRRKLAFLFLIEDNIWFERFWEQFFAAAPAHQYSVYVHNRIGKTPRLGSFFGKYLLKPEELAPTEWGSLVRGMNALLNASLTDKDNFHFTFVSASTVPVKPFREIYRALMEKESSYFCVRTTAQWVKTQFEIVPKIHQWLSLTRSHVQLLMSAPGGYRFPLWEDYKRDCCEDEFAYLTGVLGQLSFTNESKKSWTIPQINGGIPLEYPREEAQGVCHTFVLWYEGDDPLQKGMDLHGSVYVKDSIQHPAQFKEVTPAFLKELRDSSFLFARKFDVGCTLKEKKVSFLTGLARLLWPRPSRPALRRLPEATAAQAK